MINARQVPKIKFIQIDRDEYEQYMAFMRNRSLISLPSGQWAVTKIENNMATLTEIIMMMEC